MKYEDTLTPSELMAYTELDNARFAKELAERKLKKERQKSFKAVMKDVVMNICLVAVVGSIFGGMFVVSGATKVPKTRTASGTAYDWGSIIVTDDGHWWKLVDAPEFQDGTKVKVKFDTKGTTTVKDDEILSVW